MTKFSDYDKGIIRGEARLPRDERLTRTGIPSRFWDVKWIDYEERDANVDVADYMQTYAEDFQKAPMYGGRGILLQGEPGVGKTMAAAMLGVALSDSKHLVRFISLAKYMSLLVRQITLSQSWQRYENLDAHEEWARVDEELRIMREIAHLVILDDVGKEHHTASKYAVDELHLLLRERFDLGRPVVITSNLVTSEWSDMYHDAMASFVKEATEIISIADSEDMRGRAN